MYLHLAQKEKPRGHLSTDPCGSSLSGDAAPPPNDRGCTTKWSRCYAVYYANCDRTHLVAVQNAVIK